jgi:hypothetical protein
MTFSQHINLPCSLSSFVNTTLFTQERLHKCIFSYSKINSLVFAKCLWRRLVFLSPMWCPYLISLQEGLLIPLFIHLLAFEVRSYFVSVHVQTERQEILTSWYKTKVRLAWLAGTGVHDALRVWGICLVLYDAETEFSLSYMLSKRFMAELHAWSMTVFGSSG